MLLNIASYIQLKKLFLLTELKMYRKDTLLEDFQALACYPSC